MRYSSQLILTLAALMHAATTIALPTEERACPGPPSVLRALQPETCSKGACSATLFCCTCYSCVNGVKMYGLTAMIRIAPNRDEWLNSLRSSWSGTVIVIVLVYVN
ncbi:hypothetical protein B0H17DRAFT_1060849 [Mycena rosella]|uniref:Uncharacterized protein n=1 Tax=Mycena rosella TaxID=1033263 RepID=A0AAD7GL14_MYCRO|nr:hypothetical protein B0H17DRAFT_1060849 [Mycena rosella]